MQQNINPDQIQTGVLSGQIPLIGVGNKLDTSVIPSNITVDTSTNSLDSNKLNGDFAFFYRNAGNLNAGTIPAARLSGTYGISITGIASSAGSAVTAGNADNADLLGNQNSAFYRDASNLNAGIIPGARLIGTYPISISGTAAVATTASDSALLGTFNSAFYRNAGNLNAGTIPSARLSGTYTISITGSATAATNAIFLNSQPSSFYRDASNMNVGILPSARLSGTYPINISGSASQLGGLSSGSYAVINSPVFTGLPSAPTQPLGTNDTRLANTAFVNLAISTNLRYGKTWRNGNLSIPGNVNSLIAVDISAQDGSGLWSALNPSRFTANSSIRRIQLLGQALTSSVTGHVTLMIIRNGSFTSANVLATVSNSPASGGIETTQVITKWTPTVVGDYFELWAVAVQGSAAIVSGTENSTFLEYSSI